MPTKIKWTDKQSPHYNEVHEVEDHVALTHEKAGKVEIVGGYVFEVRNRAKAARAKAAHEPAPAPKLEPKVTKPAPKKAHLSTRSARGLTDER